ncbi:uncharacterized protein CDV56_102220 [Aspergillus thermomutatus]|uniref:C2H2-type domain-containing protein n=1 Tax=Aspergillus thermomutatus TaxID=41047 RepID=A0A397G6B8_ASPTH|nr:uncharacterized protein CDV56_102220 [Aspergillus thermomutatus]RHZ46562.1 hypothetical protein CDV56_102220 [Aspergillus thermomutatus]
MSQYQFDSDWSTLEGWRDSNDTLLEESQTRPNVVADPARMSICHDRSSQGLDSLLFSSTPQSFPASMYAGYTVPSAVSQADSANLGCLAMDTLPTYTSNFEGRTAAFWSGHVNYHAPIQSPPVSSGIGPLVQGPHVPSAGVNAASDDRYFGRRPSDTVNAAHDPAAIRCQWKGCPYAGVFSRKAELERHVKTQHIFPNLSSVLRWTAEGCSTEKTI